MSVGSLLRSTYLRFLSKPASQRAIYQAMSGRQVRSIVEIGIDLAVRTPRVLEAARWQAGAHSLRYTGIDLFESRPRHQPPLSLKQAHAAFRGAGAQIRLVPGDPAAALARVANSLSDTDLLLISSLADQHSLAEAWLWVPRMLARGSILLVEQSQQASSGRQWRLLPLDELHRLAASAHKARRAA